MPPSKRARLAALYQAAIRREYYRCRAQSARHLWPRAAGEAPAERPGVATLAAAPPTSAARSRGLLGRAQKEKIKAKLPEQKQGAK